jgi:sugar phosphate permease
MGLLTTIAAHGFGRMSYTIILPAMKDGLSFNYTQLGLLGTGNFIGYLTMAIVGGFMAARFGTRIIITAGLVLMGITMILTGLAKSFEFAFVMRLLTGLGNGAAFVPAMALGSAWFTMKKRGFATGIVSHLRPDSSADSIRFWRPWLAVFVVHTGRRRTFDIRCCFSICAQQPAGKGTRPGRI